MKTKAIAAAAMLVVAGSAMASPHHEQFSFSFIGNETNVLNLVGIFGLIGIKGCVTVDNTGTAVVQSSQSVYVPHVTLSAPKTGTYTTGHITYGVDSTRTVTSDHGSAYFFASKKTKEYENSSSWVNAGANGHLDTSSSFQTGAGFVAGQQSSASGSGAAWGGSDFVSLSGRAYGVGGGVVPLPGGGAIYGTHLYGVAGVTEGAIWGGYHFHQQSSASGGFLAAGFLDTQKSFDAGFHAYVNHGSSEVESSSIAERALWGFSNDYSQTTTTVRGELTLHVNTFVMPTMSATLGADALKGASGNMGVNVAAGADNVQANNVAMSAVNDGRAYVNSQVFSSQKSWGSGSIKDFYVTASVGDGALAGASGNVGVNVASGIGNVQQNGLAAAVATSKGRHDAGGAANATAQTDQKAGMYASGDFVPTASLGMGALKGATGNIGVNVAAGIGNVQNNSLAISALR